MSLPVRVDPILTPAALDALEAEALDAIDSVTTPEEAEVLLRRVKLAEDAARLAQIGGERAQRWAGLKLRAERRYGELLGPAVPGGHNVRVSDRQSDSGYKSRQRARDVATVPEPEFQEYVDTAAKPSRAGLLAAAPDPDPGKAHVSNNTGDNEWYTPAEHIEAAKAVMGAVDLDPASSAAANAVVGAATIHTADDDGRIQPWEGRVWMNPPYARPLIDDFCTKLVESYSAGDVTEACVLVNNATETGWFHTLAEFASAMCFPRRRVRFWHPEKVSAPLQGQAILYFGQNVETFRAEFVRFGFTVTL